MLTGLFAIRTNTVGEKKPSPKANITLPLKLKRVISFPALLRTHSMNYKQNIPGFMRLALFLQVVQKVGSIEFGKSFEPLPSG